VRGRRRGGNDEEKKKKERRMSMIDTRGKRRVKRVVFQAVPILFCLRKQLSIPRGEEKGKGRPGGL